MTGKEDGKIPEAITRYIVALYWQSPLLHFESSAFAFFPNDKGPTEGSEISQKPVRNRPNATSLSLPCLFPHPLTRTPTPTPIPISTTTTATATATAAGTTVSFPDRTSLFCSQIWNRMRSRNGSLLSLLDLLLLLVLPPHPLLLHHHYQ